MQGNGILISLSTRLGGAATTTAYVYMRPGGAIKYKYFKQQSYSRAYAVFVVETPTRRCGTTILELQPPRQFHSPRRLINASLYHPDNSTRLGGQLLFPC